MAEEEEEEEEIWKPIGDTKYEVSSLGRIWSGKTKAGKYLNIRPNANGYLVYSRHGELKQLSSLVHVVVATYHVPNPDNKTVVDHVDGKRDNPKASNLQWVTSAENIRRMVENNGGHNQISRKPILQYDPETGDVLMRFAGIRLACKELNIPVSSISSVLNGHCKTYRGKGWRYDEKKQEGARVIFKIEPDDTWFPIPAHPRYLIDHWGNVYSTYKEDLITPQIDSKGYHAVHIYADGIQSGYQLHRLMAKTFLTNPENKPMVNHKDGDPRNNHIDNLEWCTNSENIKHAVSTGLQKTVGVIQYNMDMKEVGRFASVSDAAIAVGGNVSNISRACKSDTRSAFDFFWRYEEDN